MDIGELRGLLLGFEKDPAAARARLAVWKSEDPQGLMRAAFEVLGTPTMRQGEQHLAPLLAEGGFDTRTLAREDGPPLEEAVKIAVRLQQLDPGFDLRLAKLAADCDGGEGTHRRCRLRCLELLRRLVTSSRIMPFQVQLMRSEDPHVRSKAAQLIAQITQNPQWFFTQLKDPDPRVRSNAIEALWRSDWPEARAIFDEALGDSHHRVVTTAWVGYYLLGEEEQAIEAIEKFARAEEPESRAAAAWAMGATGDRRCFDTLVRLTRDPSPLVRPRAYHSLRQLEKARRESLAAPAVELAAK